MNFSALLDRTLRLYRANFRPLAILAGIVFVSQLPIAMVTAPTKAGGAPGPTWGVFLLLVVVSSVLMAPIWMAAMCDFALKTLKGQTPTVGETLRAALRRYGSLVGICVLVSLASAAGTILLIVPGIYIWLGFSLSIVAMMDEGHGTVAAMKRSWHLMKERRLRVFGLSLVWGILQLVAGYAFGVVLGAVLPDRFGGTISQQIASALIFPCWGLALTLIYEHAKLEREGHDLAIDAQRLAGTDPAADPSLQSVR
jgi:hypothetical protein